MLRKWLPNLLLTVISTALTFAVAEYAYRYLLFDTKAQLGESRDPSLYVPVYEYDNTKFYSDDYFKVNYLLKRNLKLEKPHPLLGWGGLFKSDNLEHFQQSGLGKKKPVLVFGDSFAMCIDSVLCFEDVLNNDTVFNKDHFLLNYGVGGYGVDQITLLFEEIEAIYDSAFVIFSFLTTDMERSMLQMRDAQKPYFEMENNELVLKGTPIELNTDEFIAENPPEITSYLYQRILSAMEWREAPASEEHIAQIEAMKELNGALLRRAFNKLKSRAGNYMVLLFNPAYIPDDNWRLQFAINLCESEGVNYRYVNDILQERTTGEFNPYDFTIPGDGHPTSRAYKILGEEIKEMLELTRSDSIPLQD